MSDTPALYPVPPDFAAKARIDRQQYERLYDASISDPEAFWGGIAERLDWMRKPTRIKDVSYQLKDFRIRWYEDGELNASVNCLDRQLESRGDKTALLFEPDDPAQPARKVTYRELHRRVCKLANALRHLGIGKGDVVTIYLPMIPEAAVAMLACARIGAIHSVVFGGFSPNSIADRVSDCKSKLIITADEGLRGGKKIPLKANVDAALKLPGTNTVETVLVVRHTGAAVDMQMPRDRWYDAVVDGQPDQCEPERMNAEDPLFVLYTSGSTGKPKGVLHTTGGYLVYVSYTHECVFDLREEDIYWCTADVGWVTGHSYIVYGPLANRATSVLYEGTPNTPHEGRHWEIVQKYGVTIYYTAPTLIRTFMKWGNDIPAKFDRSSLRLLGSVGEPINPEAWMWYREHIGDNRCPIVDTWWQTETGAIMISPLPGVTSTKPGSAQAPLPGVSAKVVDDAGNEVGKGGGGYLVLDQPWPSMLRGIWGDDERFQETYWSRFADQGYYFAGDGAKYDADGDVWLLGRVDDVMNVSGHRISTTEVESALVSHPTVAEAAVVGATDPTTGQGIVAFVILRGGVAQDEAKGADAIKALRDHVAKEIGPIAKPRQIMVVPELPKTRSGKIMRRLLRDVAENRQVGDVTTLADSSVMDLISAGLKTGAAED